MKPWARFAVIASLVAAPLLFVAGVFFERQSRQGASIPAKATATKEVGQPSFSPKEREEAKAIDDDLAKQCQTRGDEWCRSAQAMLLLQAQMRLAEWGYGTKFTAQADSETISAIRLYQQRNGLPATGKLDGLMGVRMDADEKAVATYPFTLPPFSFIPEEPSQFQEFFDAEGVFRDTSSGDVSGPIHIECNKGWHLCFEEESTTLTPNVAKMTIKRWTSDLIVAEEESRCYTNQLRIERSSKTVGRTSVKM